MADEIIQMPTRQAAHVVRVTQYEDAVNQFALFHRETVIGAAPEGFVPFVVAAAVPIETSQGIRPMNVQGAVDGATTLEEAIAAAVDAQLEAMRQQATERPRILRPGDIPGGQRRG